MLAGADTWNEWNFVWVFAALVRSPPAARFWRFVIFTPIKGVGACSSDESVAGK